MPSDRPGTSDRPLRVAIVGSGPAGFYTADHLLRRDVPVRIDVFERLPAPFGLVRYGVAPDHPKIKNVGRVYEKIASRPEFRFYGNVQFGKHVTVEDLCRHYHQICFATGAESDRRLGVPGEELTRSHTATEFVAWYNGHLDYRERQFDLSVERVAVIGVGNVAVDVCRILCRTVDRLARTDIADYALDALGSSRVQEVTMIGRRGPAQAAFTNPELRELGELTAADVIVRPEDLELDPFTRAELESDPDRDTLKKLEILAELAARRPAGRARRLALRFCLSPAELIGNEAGEVTSLRLVRTRLEPGPGDRLRAVATAEIEELEADMVFRSVGYRGVALAGVPFHEEWGVVPNRRGRVLTGANGAPVRGLYVSGWIKRGPSGVIGSNRPDAEESVLAMLEDLERGSVLQPAEPSCEAADRFVRARQTAAISFEVWLRLDALELARGEAFGRARVKFTAVDEMLAALER
ncbi:MAG: FAD-dependent oxidoreductase [Acidobacteriota bacterium]|nr:MAG: FAD-dependent oxidoreductase [Acidobacteriota bacterium]